MEWTQALAIIAGCGFVGGLIDDYWLGAAGQRRMRDSLVTWWIRFSDVRISNFGRQEALIAVRIMDRLFGARLFSVRRLLVAFVTPLTVLILVWLSVSLRSGASFFSFIGDWNLPFVVFSLGLSTLLFWTSLSFTRAYARLVARLCGDGPLRNFLVFIMTLAASYCLAAFSAPLSVSLASEGGLRLAVELSDNGGLLWGLVTFDGDKWFELFLTIFGGFYYTIRNFHLSPLPMLHYLAQHMQVDPNPRMVLVNAHIVSSLIVALLPGLGRIAMLLVFIASYALTPLHAPILSVWAKIIDSGRPILTVTFGAVAGIAQGLKWLLDHVLAAS